MGLGETSSPPVGLGLGEREEVGGGGDWVGRGGASPVSSFLGPVGRTHARRKARGGDGGDEVGGGWGRRWWVGMAAVAETRTRQGRGRRGSLDWIGRRKGWVGRWVRVLVFQEKIHRWMGA